MKDSRISFLNDAKKNLIAMAVVNMAVFLPFATALLVSEFDGYIFALVFWVDLGILELCLFLRVWRLGKFKQKCLGVALLVIPLGFMGWPLYIAYLFFSWMLTD